METPPQDGGVDMEEVWPSESGSVCISRDNPLSAVVVRPSSGGPAPRVRSLN